jgi:hypothetical protein
VGPLRTTILLVIIAIGVLGFIAAARAIRIVRQHDRVVFGLSVRRRQALAARTWATSRVRARSTDRGPDTSSGLRGPVSGARTSGIRAGQTEAGAANGRLPERGRPLISARKIRGRLTKAVAPDPGDVLSVDRREDP